MIFKTVPTPIPINQNNMGNQTGPNKMPMIFKVGEKIKPTVTK
jgi:hypothetical protein